MVKKKNNYKNIDEFNNKIKFNDRLGLDMRDNLILTLIQSNANVSQDQIAKAIGLSQPSVNARINKLKEKGVLSIINGINFKKVDLYLGKIDVHSKDTNAIINEFKDCPFFLNAFITSGRFNLCLFFMATDLKRLEGMVNHHLRNNPLVKELEFNLIISTAKDFVMPTNINYSNKNQMDCDQHCRFLD